MGLVLKILITTMQCVKFIMPFLALLYMVVWAFIFEKTDLFNQFNAYLGFLPDKFNEIFNLVYDINGQDVLMGYPLASLLFLIIMFVCHYLQNFFEVRLLIHNDTVYENKKEQAKIRNIIKEIEAEKVVFERLDKFYGLLEIKLTKNELFNNQVNLEEVKKKYLRTIILKIKNMFPKIKIEVTNGIYFNISSFNDFTNLVKELINVLKILKQISQKKMFDFDFVLSFYSTNNKEKNKRNKLTLVKINKLNMQNKIVVSKDVRNSCYKYEKFDFVSLGTSILFALNDKDFDTEVELYSLVGI